MIGHKLLWRERRLSRGRRDPAQCTPSPAHPFKRRQDRVGQGGRRCSRTQAASCFISDLLHISDGAFARVGERVAVVVGHLVSRDWLAHEDFERARPDLPCVEWLYGGSARVRVRVRAQRHTNVCIYIFNRAFWTRLERGQRRRTSESTRGETTVRERQRELQAETCIHADACAFSAEMPETEQGNPQEQGAKEGLGKGRAEERVGWGRQGCAPCVHP